MSLKRTNFVPPLGHLRFFQASSIERLSNEVIAESKIAIEETISLNDSYKNTQEFR